MDDFIDDDDDGPVRIPDGVDPVKVIYYAATASIEEILQEFIDLNCSDESEKLEFYNIFAAVISHLLGRLITCFGDQNDAKQRCLQMIDHHIDQANKYHENPIPDEEIQKTIYEMQPIDPDEDPYGLSSMTTEGNA